MRSTLAVASLLVLTSRHMPGESGSPSAGPSEGPVVIRIADSKDVHEYTVAVGHAGPSLRSVIRASVSDDARHEALVAIGRAGDTARRERELAAARLSPAPQPPPKWALLSPDGLHAVVGYEDPISGPMRTASLLRVPDSTVLWSVKLRGYVEDTLWMEDSKTVLLLESTERWLKSPRGLLRLLVGHPIPLNTIYLTACDVASRQCRRIEIASDLEFATVRFWPQGTREPGVTR